MLRVVVVVVMVLLMSTLASAQPAEPAPAPAQPAETTPAPAQPAEAPVPAPRQRISVLGHFGAGPILQGGGSLRYQLYNLLVRLGGVHGVNVESEGDGFDAAFLHVGGTTGGTFYVFGEVGAIVVRKRPFYEDENESYGPSWDVYPNATAGLGVKIDALDLALAAWYPMAGIGLNLGVDLHAW